MKLSVTKLELELLEGGRALPKRGKGFEIKEAMMKIIINFFLFKKISMKMNMLKHFCNYTYIHIIKPEQ